MKIAVCQTEIVYEDKAANYEKAGQMLREAREAGAELALFPEMSFTGFSMHVALLAEARGETVAELGGLARETGVAAGFGWAKRGEAGGGKARNQYTVVGPDGAVLCDYSKIHAFSFGGEDRFFAGGDEPGAFELGGVRFGVAVCYDMRFPELFTAAPQDVTAFVVPANWPKPRLMHWEALLRARAIDSQSYVVGINCVGRQGKLDYPGHSAVYGPSGEALLELGGDEAVGYCEVSAAAALEWRASFKVRQDRKPELYRRMLGGA